MSKLTFEAMENMCAKEPMSGCWIWEKRTNAGGYGMARAGELAHRVCYELAGNEIPKGLDLMHLCHNRLCINPAHLRPGTRKENVMMSVNANRWNLALRSEKQKANRAKLSRNGLLRGPSPRQKAHIAARRALLARRPRHDCGRLLWRDFSDGATHPKICPHPRPLRLRSTRARTRPLAAPAPRRRFPRHPCCHQPRLAL